MAVGSGKRVGYSGVPRVERLLGGSLLGIGKLYPQLLMGERRPWMLSRGGKSESDDCCAQRASIEWYAHLVFSKR